MPWQRELVGMAIVMAFMLSGGFMFGAVGFTLGLIGGVLVAAYTRTL